MPFRILASKSPTVIEFVLIEEGPWHESKRGPKNKQLYSTRETLQAAVAKFDGLPVQVVSRNVNAGDKVITIADHIPANEKIALGKSGNSFYIKDIAGFIRSPRLEDIDGKATIIGPVHFHDEAVAQTLRGAIEAGDLDIIGGSIDGAPARFDMISVNGTEYEVPWIESLDTWDLVTLPAAGGRMLRLAASRSINEEKETKMTAKQKAVILSLLHAAGVKGTALEGVLADNADFGKEALAALKTAFTDKPELMKEVEAVWEKLGKSETVEDGIAALGRMEEKLTVKPEPAKPEPVQAVKPEPEPAKPVVDPAVAEANKILESAKATQEKIETQLGEMEIEKHVTASRLPDLVQSNLRASLRASCTYKEPEIQKAIDAHRKYLSDIGAAQVHGVRIAASIEAGTDAMDNLLDRAQTMFTRGPLYNAKKELVKPITSFKEFWRLTASADEIEKGYNPEKFFRKLAFNLTMGRNGDGEAFVASDYVDPETGRITASLLSTDWAQIIATTMHRQMARDYRVDQFQDWRKIVEITSIDDLKARYFARLGGYPTAPSVAEGGTYQSVTSSPGDESSTLSITKYGHIEDFTEEMVIKDDIRGMALLTQRLGRGMAIDTYLMVFDMITNNDAVAFGADTATLINNTSHSHGAESGGSTLQDSTFNTAYQAMIAQAAYGDTRAYIDNAPKYIICGYTQARMAKWISNPAMVAQATSNFPAYTGLNNPNANDMGEPIILKHITSTTNWWAIADPTACPTIIVGFYQGKDAPELVTEAAGTGAHFTADTIRIKVKHRRGAVLHDYRGIYGQLA